MPISINKIYSIWNYIKLKESKYTPEFKWDFTIWNSYYLIVIISAKIRQLYFVV